MIKKITVAFSAVLLLLSSLVHAQKNEKLEFVKERSIAKTYPAAGNTLEIENTFGSIKINTWDKNEIKIDVKIKVASSDKENSERTFEHIVVSDEQSGNNIRFKTTIKSDKDNSCNNCSTNMNINYEVYLPATVALDLENTFGNIDLPDFKGTVSLNNKFGNLTAGTLTSVKKLNLEFGKAQLKGLTDLHANFKFSKVQIESLSGANDISMEFCDSSKIVLANNLSSLELKESYSTINLKPASGLSASYRIRTSFGGFIDRTSIGVVRTDTPDRYGADSNKEYEGKSGSGTARISVKSSFGRIILGEATPEDMKKTSKSKSKYAGKVI